MKVVVKLFGEFREAIGQEKVELEIPNGTSVYQALRHLAEGEPKVGELLFNEGKLRDHLHVFVNGLNVATLGGLELKLNDGDTIAFFPPVGGG